MPQVGISTAASDFGPVQTMAVILLLNKIARFERLEKTGPTCARIIFGR